MAVKKIVIRPEGTNDYADELHPKTSASQVVEETNKKFMTDAERSKLSALPQTTYDRASSVLSGANVFSNIVVTDGAVTALATRAMTKADIGLSAVLNYGIATQAEAEAGTSDVKYMTPLGVKNSIIQNADHHVSGSYAGSVEKTSYPASSVTPWRYISLGFQPSILWFDYADPLDFPTLKYSETYPRMATEGGVTSLEITPDGFRVREYISSTQFARGYSNISGTTYRYVAIK